MMIENKISRKNELKGFLKIGFIFKGKIHFGAKFIKRSWYILNICVMLLHYFMNENNSALNKKQF